MKVGICAKRDLMDFGESFKQIFQWLRSRDCNVVVQENVVHSFDLEGVVAAPLEEIPAMVDVIIVFGGDGTILSVARAIRGCKAKILGVNLGSLGFLTELTLDELYPALEKVLEGDYNIDRRFLLRTEIHFGDKTAQTHHALNDAVINKGALARIMSIDAFVDDRLVANFLSDGLIISTPTGSTAYSLSAGGPVVYPTIDSLVMTPICPHTLTNRPLVVPAESTIRVVVKTAEDAMLTIDGQIGIKLNAGDEIFCTRSDYKVELVQAESHGFFQILREKLKWGER